MTDLVDVYVYRREQNSCKLLLLKRAPDVIYAGQWRMVGGKVERPSEKAFEAAQRELYEETGLRPRLLWTLPSVNQFYDPKQDVVHHIPAFAAEVEAGIPLRLNHEHIAAKWVTEDEISAYIHWSEQKRLMRLLVSIVTSNQLLDEWIITH